MRSVVGLIGPVCIDQCRAVWNTALREQGSPLDFQFYRTRNREELELRLSEMFTLGRLGYIVHPEFQSTVLPLLDRLDSAAHKKERVDTIVNDGGVLVGYYLDASVNEAQEQRCKLWLGSQQKEYVA